MVGAYETTKGEAMSQMILVDLDDLGADCECSQLDEDGDPEPCTCGCCGYLDGLFLEQREQLWRDEMAELAFAAAEGFTAQADRLDNRLSAQHPVLPEAGDQPILMWSAPEEVRALDIASQRAVEAAKGHHGTNAWLHRQRGYVR